LLRPVLARYFVHRPGRRGQAAPTATVPL